MMASSRTPTKIICFHLLYHIVSIIVSGNAISNDFTFYYRTYHYEFPSTIESNATEISISDIFDNNYTLDVSGTITINNAISLNIFSEDDWREIHYRDTDSQRRRMWGRYWRYHCSGWARAFGCRQWKVTNS